jgi:hypothetical protein
LFSTYQIPLSISLSPFISVCHTLPLTIVVLTLPNPLSHSLSIPLSNVVIYTINVLFYVFIHQSHHPHPYQNIQHTKPLSIVH